MLTIYLVCLIVGGVLVGLSALSGLKDGDLGGKDIDANGDEWGSLKDFAIDKSGFSKDLEMEPSAFGEASLAGKHQAMQERPRRPVKKTSLWVPFGSMRFWTFGACFFGLTGVTLSQFSHWSPASVLIGASAIGVAAGTLTAWTMQRLRQPVGKVMDSHGWVGVIGELTHPLSASQLSKVRVRQASGAARELLAVLAPGDRRELPRHTAVVILEVRDGRALVEPAEEVMLAPTLERLSPHPVTQEDL